MITIIQRKSNKDRRYMVPVLPDAVEKPKSVLLFKAKPAPIHAIIAPRKLIHTKSVPAMKETNQWFMEQFAVHDGIKIIGYSVFGFYNDCKRFYV